ncbi:hypothetical protein HRG_008161 [Hirsutella rhossiliensis]|uniref:Uncharacterized protein n=1 Tax=Hirsutella rhossiliensis TaxID=111463 RepID=A0A9P8SFJ7_9HYPO|nr:uncharacterized protein HRG_08161 [Hirsutella rhossiliensis]KAH0961008.1 hypothetical protein HRG_08161 [Hirsutella rhossiliensis]
MKSLLAALLAALVVGAAAAPAQQASQAHRIDSNRRFFCPKRVQAFCSASNIHSGCTFGGTFRSDAMDTCRDCTC